MVRDVLVAVKSLGELALLADTAVLVAPGARVRLIHVVLGQNVAAELAGQRLLDDGYRQLQAEGLDVESSPVLAPLGGSVAARLAEQVRIFSPGLVVMGSRGVGRVAGLVRQSVSQAVLADIETTAVVVPPHAPPRAGPLRHVLVAIGGEHETDPLLDALLRLPGRPEVLLVHVPLPVAAHLASPGMPYFEVPETSAEMLEPLRRALLGAHRPVVARLAPGRGRVAEVIAQTARLWDADLIVVGSRRPGRLARLGAGSTAHDLLRCADRPVLLAPGT
jgi:nucleotide-binding universal stress UspA family protein